LRGVETTVYRVRVRLLAMKLEDDQDIHLVIADPATGGTMIAESPAPACTRGAAPAVRRMMARARASIIRACGIPPSRFFAARRRDAFTRPAALLVQPVSIVSRRVG
jgi:hypothetical protein